MSVVSIHRRSGVSGMTVGSTAAQRDTAPVADRECAERGTVPTGTVAAVSPLAAISSVAVRADGLATTAVRTVGSGTGSGPGSGRGGPGLRLVREAGMATAEYAVALIAACAFAAVLLTVIRAGQVAVLLGKLISAALKVIG